MCIDVLQERYFIYMPRIPVSSVYHATFYADLITLHYIPCECTPLTFPGRIVRRVYTYKNKQKMWMRCVHCKLNPEHQRVTYDYAVPYTRDHLPSKVYIAGILLHKLYETYTTDVVVSPCRCTLYIPL